MTIPQNQRLSIAISSVILISEEVHSDCMEIREAKEEHCFTDEGEEINCPVCGTTWLKDIEGDVTTDSCEHLRFSLHSECVEDFEIFEDWDSDSFLDMVKQVRAKDEEIDILDILEGIQHPDIDKAIVYIWQDDPLNHPWMIWGYQED
jgi:hypothetical protein